MAMAEAAMAPPFRPPASPCATLYVGDLHPAVAEPDLFRAFAAFGPVSSVCVCCDAFTGESLRYAYVNFLSFPHAAIALKALNHSPLKGKPMRIMWSHRNPLPRKSGVGNLFVKNLDASIGGKELENLFSLHGAVVSCKVATDDRGKSKRFGFVQMDSEEAAQAAIRNFNGTILFLGQSKPLYVTNFVKKGERQAREVLEGRNLYIKNLDSDFTDDHLRDKFSQFGKVISAVVMKDELGRSRCFGFVSFELAEHAKKAIGAMNGAQFGSKCIYVGLAQKKAVREELLKQQFARRDMRHHENKGSNVYVKNLDNSVDQKALLDYFGGCGKVVSTKVIYDTSGQSRGFGFVHFSSPEEAKKAVAKYNATMFHGKLLHVATASCRDDHLNSLQQSYCARTLPLQIPVFGNYPLEYYPPNFGVPQNLTNMHQMFICQPQHQQRELPSGNITWAHNIQPLRTPPQHFSICQLPHPAKNANLLQSMQCKQQARHCWHGDYSSSVLQIPKSNSSVNAVRKTHHSKSDLDLQKSHSSAKVGKKAYNSEVLSQQLKALAKSLAAVDPKGQKQMIGELLYPLVQDLEAKHASKITGMLLEMDKSELQKIMVSRQLLSEWVEEAVHLLKGVKKTTSSVEHNNISSVLAD